MSFQKENLIVSRGTFNTYATPNGLITHTYYSDVDDQTTISSPSYFPDYLDSNKDFIKTGDILFVRDSVPVYKSYKITTLSPISLIEVTTDANPFNQQLNTTNDVIFAKSTLTTGLQLPTSGGTPAVLNYYEESQSFNLPMAGSFSGSPVNVNVDYTRIGNLVSWRIDSVTLTQTGAGIITIADGSIPVNIRPTMGINQQGPIIIDNGVWMGSKIGLNINGGATITKLDNSNFSGVGTIMIQEGPLHYYV